MNATFLRTLILASALALQPAAAGAVTFIVNVAGQDKPDANPGDGKCSHSLTLDPEQFAVCTLRAAIMEGNATPLNNSVLILLTPGETYPITIAGSAENAAAKGDFDILRSMTIRVPEGFASRAIIDAKVIDRAFEIVAASTLYGLEIRNGFRSDRNGTAILSTKAATRFVQMDINHNQVGEQGGESACILAGSFILDTSRVHHNGTTTNPASAICGGAITITQSTIDNNAGAGVLMLGVQTQLGTLTMRTSTVSSNGTSGVFLKNSDGSIQNSTIAKNKETQLQYASNLNEPLELTVKGSIIDGSDSQFDACNTNQHDFGQAAFTTAWNAYSDLSCFSDIFVDNSLHEADIRLTPLDDFGGLTPTHSLMANSEVIDSAPASVCNNFPVDQRGFTRPISHNGQPMPRCDTGAVELQVGEQQDVVFSDDFE